VFTAEKMYRFYTTLWYNVYVTFMYKNGYCSLTTAYHGRIHKLKRPS